MFLNKDGGFFPVLTFRPHMNGVFRAPNNAGFTKWSAEFRFLKTPASRLLVDVRKWSFSNTVMSYIIQRTHPVRIEGSLSYLRHFKVSVWMGKHDLNLLGVEAFLFKKKP